MERATIRVYLTAVLIFGIAGGCAQTPPPTPLEPVETGWEPFPIPRTFSPPGTIIWSHNGVWYPVEKLEYKHDAGGNLAGFTYTKSYSFTAGTLLTALGLIGSISDAGVDVDLEKGYTQKTTVKNPKREIVQLDDKTFRSELNAWLETHKFRSEGEYFVIVGTDSTKSIFHEVSGRLVANIGGKAIWNSLVKATPNLKSSATSSYSLTQDFGTYYRIFYLAYPITEMPEAGLAGTRNYRLEKEPSVIPGESLRNF